MEELSQPTELETILDSSLIEALWDAPLQEWDRYTPELVSVTFSQGSGDNTAILNRMFLQRLKNAGIEEWDRWGTVQRNYSGFKNYVQHLTEDEIYSIGVPYIQWIREALLCSGRKHFDEGVISTNLHALTTVSALYYPAEEGRQRANLLNQEGSFWKRSTNPKIFSKAVNISPNEGSKVTLAEVSYTYLSLMAKAGELKKHLDAVNPDDYFDTIDRLDTEFEND